MHDDLPHAMRETARRLEPDVVRLTAGGVTRGTRMRRIERIVQVVGSVVAVCVVFAGVALIGSHRTTGADDGGGPVNQPAGSAGGGVGGTSATDVPSPSNVSGTATAPNSTGVPSPTGALNSTGIPEISGDKLISILKSSLDGTGVTGRSFVPQGSDYDWATKTVPAGGISVSAQLVVADQVGSIAVTAYGAQQLKEVPKLGKPSPQPDGSVVYVSEQSASSDGRHADRTDLDVTLVRTDGSSLHVLETNAANVKSAAASGARLLLSPGQVIAMVDSPTWDAAIAAADSLPFSQQTSATVPPDAYGNAYEPSGSSS